MDINMKKKAIYYCTSVYQVLILTMMVELYYDRYENIVIMGTDLADKLCLDALRKYADEVVILSSSASEYEMTNRLDALREKKDIALFGMFTWGVYGAYIYDKIPRDIRIVLLDEGISTYEYKEFMCNHVGRDIDFSRISEIWMIDPAISQNDGTVPEHRIQIERILEDKARSARYLDRVNGIFKYRHESLDVDILFFDRYMVQTGRIPIKYERFVIESICKLAGRSALGIKVHPSEERGLPEWRYRNLPIALYQEFDVPWELVVLNYMYHYDGNGGLGSFPQVLISANTTTLFFTQTLLNHVGIDIPIIYINKIIHYYLKDLEVIVEKTIEGYKQTYIDRKIFLPDSWKGLYDALKTCIREYEPRPDIVEEIHAAEYGLLCDEYRKTLTMEGNLLQRVYLEVVNEETSTAMQYRSYMIAGETEYTVLFEDCAFTGKNEIELRFFPADLPPLCQSVIIKKLSYCRNGRKIEEHKMSEYKLTYKSPYVSFVIQPQGDEISRPTIVFTTSREYNILSEVRNAEKFQDYFGQLAEWIGLLQLGIHFSDYCSKKEYRTIGIYGNGKMGRLLRNQMDGEGIDTVMIDQKAFEDCIAVSDAAEHLERFDLIIVTPLVDFYNIHKKFGCSDKVVGIDDFLQAIRNDSAGK